MDLLELARSAIPQQTEPAKAEAHTTPDQAAELRWLVPEVCRLCDEADLDGALAIALADPDDALISFRALAAERAKKPPATIPGTDMRTCNDCLNLSPAGRCLAAMRGESFGPGMAVTRDWSPAMTDRPQRCAPYRPGPNDPDRRPGSERWPRLVKATEIQ